MISTVHVVFKTHLDVGFTGLAADVIDRYVHSYLPRAIALADELEKRDGTARFVWTTGSWLIRHALDSGSFEERLELERAIRAGAIRWHGLPLTTHTELMDAGLAAHGASIARRLDRRFGMRTIAAKMTDVPGHTIGLVPVLAQAGIEYLHLGVNGASAVPDVPEFFVWRAPDGSEVVVNYAHSYGAEDLGVAVGPDGTTAMHLAHTGDNFGPPSADDVERLFADLASAYPGARIMASTLDAFAADVLPWRDTLPVVEDEIGDSWIHGAGADPLLTAGLRNLAGLRTRWIESGDLDPDSAEGAAFSDALLLVAEHTWGKDLKTWLPDYVNYAKPDFAAARERGTVDTGLNPDETRSYAWAYEEHPGRALTYAGFEDSWQEQRDYLSRAVAALSPERAAQAQAALDALHPSGTTSEGTAVLPGEDVQVGLFRVRLGDDGSLVSLIDPSGREWAGDDHRLGSYRYQTFDENDERIWMEQYCRDLERNAFWAVPDQSKPGLAIARTHPASVFAPRVASALLHTDAHRDALTVTLELPAAACEVWGAPRSLRLEYAFPRTGGAIVVTLSASDRDASRLPEASWLGFRPRPGGAQDVWRLDKLGTLVDPARVVSGGNRRLHAVRSVHRRGDASFCLTTLDAPLVAVGEPQLYRFGHDVARPEDGFHVNLHNNTWGTNFRMWFDDDLRYRFELDLA